MNSKRIGISLTPQVLLELNNQLRIRHLKSSFVGTLLNATAKAIISGQLVIEKQAKHYGKRQKYIASIYAVNSETAQLLAYCKKYYGVKVAELGRYAINQWLGSL